MIAWGEWRADAFAQAQKRGAPILLLLPSGSAHEELEKAFAGLEGVIERAVALCADRCDRPDLVLRYGPGPGVCLLSQTGALLGRCSLSEAGQKLPEWVDGYKPAAAPAAAQAAPWTGAVGGAARAALPQDRPQKIAAGLLATSAPLSMDAFELVLYAASEWKDEAARERLEREAGRLARSAAAPATLGSAAATARLLWDAHAVLKSEVLRDAALSLTASILRDFRDTDKRALRHAAAPTADFFADENAQAAVALLRAAAFEPGFKFRPAAEEILTFLRDSAYDPMLGMIHRRREGGTMVYGLLADNAWTILAFTEAFMLDGHKAHREFADGLARFLFQELWDRDHGAFGDRVPLKDDAGLLREPRRARAADNAAALEGLWRLHHLKGNMNYKRWLDWGLGSLVDVEGAEAAPLARVQDMLVRGRLDLELVGRPDGPGVEELLASLHRHYLPRRIVSFVDPDDQDYILAHKLEVVSVPTVFGCLDLRPVGSARGPHEVAALLKALS